jgi:tRNA threonylcarbamoyladenosine biosynthesis protein TsaE
VTTAPADAALSLELASESATAALAARVAGLAAAGDVIALRGELGSGKTTFARGFIRARGRADEEVPSPTFTLVEVYEFPHGAPAVWHFDLYRLGKSEDAYELGFEEALAGAILLIEWPERLGPLLPHQRLDVTLAAGSSPHRRRVRIQASPAWARRLGRLASP